MQSGAGHFFYFLGMLIALEFTGQALGRLLCALCRKQVTANSMSSVVILIFGTVGGFMPNYTTIPPILRWLSWVTPCSYAFEGLMLNEFVDLDFEFNLMGTSDGEVIPIDIGGNDWLKIYSLPRSDFADTKYIKLFDIMMVLVFALVYDTLGKYIRMIASIDCTGMFLTCLDVTLRILFHRKDTGMVPPSNQAPSGDCKVFVRYRKRQTACC